MYRVHLEKVFFLGGGGGGKSTDLRPNHKDFLYSIILFVTFNNNHYLYGKDFGGEAGLFGGETSPLHPLPVDETLMYEEYKVM